MSKRSEDASRRIPEDRANSSIEEHFAEYAERLTGGEELDPKAILREHPEFGRDLLEHLEDFLDLAPDAISPCPLGFLGDYELLRQVGRGGMGIVYEAWENSMDRRVALKVLPAAVAADNRTFMRFCREARLAGKLHHRSIVPVFAMGVKDDSPYYAMEFVEGETLAQILARIKDAAPETETPFGPKDHVDYIAKLTRAFADVAEGLQHAHSKGVVHRDIKPSNLILDGEGRLRILDFGLARLEGQESLTLSGDFVGTPAYMSPEQAKRRKIPLDHRTDVYSLGATMYETLCGRPPFRGRDHADTLSQIIDQDPVEPRKTNPRVPKDLETIVLKCLRKDAGDRYGTAEALGQDLKRFVRGDPIEARPQSAVERLARKLVREWRKILLLAVLVVLGAGCALLASFSWHQRQRVEHERYDKQVLHQKMILLRNQTILETASGKKNLDREALILFLPADLAQLAFGRNPVEEAVEKLAVLTVELPRRFEAHYFLAKGLLLLGQPADARDALERALSCNPSFIPARILREELDDRDGAAAHVKAWLDQEDELSWQALWFTAHVAERGRNWSTASHVYTQMIELARETEGEFYLGSTTDLYLRRSSARIEVGSLLKARQDLAFLHLSWPELLEPAFSLSKTYYIEENRQEARDVLEDIYRTADSTNEVATWCAVFCTSMGDSEQAILWTDRMEELSPEQTSIKKRIESLALFRLGSWTEACQVVEEMIELDPQDSMALYMKAQFIYLEKAYSRPKSQAKEPLGEIIRLGEEVTRLHNAYAPAHSLLALAYQDRGDPEKALESYRKAVELQPVNLMVLEPLCLMLYKLAKIDDLRSLHRKARKSMVDLSRREEAFFVGWSGFFHRIDGREEDAVAAYDEAARLDPRLHWSLRNSGIIRFEQGAYELAADYARKAMARAPSQVYWENGAKLLATVLERQGRPDEAVRVCCESITADPLDKAAHEDLLALQFRYRSPLLLNGLEHLLNVLEDLPEKGGRDHRLVLRTLAFLKLHVPSRKDVTQASDAISRVLEARPKDLFAVLILAAAQHEAGELPESILTLEGALRGRRVYTFHAELLSEYRDEIFPDLVSFDSIDAALQTRSAESADDQRFLDEFRRAATGPHGTRCLTYLEGRLLQLAGDSIVAAEKFVSLANTEASEVGPHLRLAECLRSDGRPQETEAYLRQILGKRVSGGGALWKLWLRLCLEDLDLEPRQVLDRLPAGMEGYAENVRWLLEQLDGDGTLRINCGGEEYRDHSGADWGRDRFARGGERVVDRSRAIRETADEGLHQTTRRFRRDEFSSGYSVPLPSGSYRVTIHMVGEQVQPGADNPVEVVVEGTVKLELQGYVFKRWCQATKAMSHERDVHVKDGSLDIEFRTEALWPQVSAIEIIPLSR